MKKALYRVFRPRTFDEVLGQDHITSVLKNQVKNGNPGHAYLFAGSRGTGKTSSAKIFARAVNCLHPVDGNPCNECANCQAILNETTMDVVEMDAASNRRIDDIRELRDNVIYPPAQLKYKVYIIDEAHMITTEAFNALLKIMEEPPSHLIFILATTNPDNIPLTIVSRTQRYEFRRLDIPSIEKNLLRIGEKLGVDIEPAALHGLAIAADGSMRDGLSLMDQLLADGEKVIQEKDVEEVLGTVGFESVAAMSRAIFSDQVKKALALSDQLLLEGKDPHIFIKELIDYFRLLLLVKALGKDYAELPVDDVQKKTMEEIAGMTSMERIADSIEILIDGEILIRKADFGEAILQSLLVRLVNYWPRKNWMSRLEALEDKLLKLERNGLSSENISYPLPERKKPQAKPIEKTEKVAKSSEKTEEVTKAPEKIGERVKASKKTGEVVKAPKETEEAAEPKDKSEKLVKADARREEVKDKKSAFKRTSESSSKKDPQSKTLEGEISKEEKAESKKEEAGEKKAPKESEEENAPSSSKSKEEIFQWFSQHKSEISKEVEDHSIAPAILFEKLVDLDLVGQKLYLFYPNNGQGKMVRTLIEPHTKDLEKLFKETLGQEFEIHLLLQGQKIKGKEAEKKPKKPSKETMDTEKKLKETFSPDILDIVP